MKVSYLERWVQSPVAGRRRKAIKLLTKYAMRNKYDLAKIFDFAKNAVNDDNWQVRATAVSCLTQLALKNNSILNDVVGIYLELLGKEEHHNVIGNILRGFSTLISRYDLDQIEDIYRMSMSLIDNANNDIKHGAICLLTNIGLRFEEKISEIVDKFGKIIDTVPPLLKKDILESIRRLYLKYPDRLNKTFAEITHNYLNEADFLPRKEALINLSYLIRNDHAEINNELIDIIRRRLRDSKVAVRIVAIDVVDAVLEKNAELVDKFMDIIANEILLRAKNNRLKIRTLQMLLKHIEKIPREITYRYNLSRALDILEYNTIPKNEDLRTIKTLARKLLEEKLGYGYEERIRLRK